MLRELIVDQNLRPGRPKKDEAPQLSDKAWMIIQLCWDAEPASRPTVDTVCNKLSTISSIHLPAIPLNPLLGRSPPIQRNSGQSVFLDNINPISRPDSPPVSRSPPRRAASNTMPVSVPGLQSAFTTLNLILTAVEQTQAFKHQLQVLASCTETLLKTLETQYRSGQLTEESTFHYLQNLNKFVASRFLSWFCHWWHMVFRFLDDLANFVQRRSSSSFLSLLLMKDNSLVTINAYHSRIMAIIQAFQVYTLLPLSPSLFLLTAR